MNLHKRGSHEPGSSLYLRDVEAGFVTAEDVEGLGLLDPGPGLSDHGFDTLTCCSRIFGPVEFGKFPGMVTPSGTELLIGERKSRLSPFSGQEVFKKGRG
jgi:hypothetical protein